MQRQMAVQNAVNPVIKDNLVKANHVKHQKSKSINMKNYILAIIASVTLYACSTPLDKKYNEETLKQDLEAIQKQVDSTDYQILAGTYIRYSMQGKDMSAMTYEQLLKEGKDWKAEQERIEAEQKAMAEKAAKEEAARIARLQEAVMVSCYEKGFTKYDYQEYITYKFVIKNKTEKDIRALKGGLMFTNLFDDEIKKINFVYDEPIAAGQEVSWSATTDYNQFIDSDRTLKNKDLEDMKLVWQPEKIMFVDGSSLE